MSAKRPSTVPIRHLSGDHYGGCLSRAAATLFRETRPSLPDRQVHPRDVCFRAPRRNARSPVFTHRPRELLQRPDLPRPCAAAPGAFAIPLCTEAARLPRPLSRSESVGRNADLFDLIDKNRRVYVRKAGPARSGALFDVDPATAPPRHDPTRTPAAVVRDTERVQREADRLLLARYAPASVVIDDDLNVLQFRGRDRALFQHASGPASLNSATSCRARSADAPAGRPRPPRPPRAARAGADRDLADGPTRAEHHDPLPRAQPGPPGERHPGGHRGQAQGGDRRRPGRRRQRHQVGVATAHRSARLPSPGAIPAEVANQTRVPAGQRVGLATRPPPERRARRAPRRPEVRGARGAEQVQRDHGRRGHPDQGVARPRPRVRVSPTTAACPAGEDGGAHGSGGDVGVGQRRCAIAGRRRSGTPAARGRARTWR